MENNEQEIINLEEELRLAMINSETVILDKLISDDLVCTFTDGNLYTKQQDLDLHNSGVVKFNKIDVIEREIRVLENTAVVVVLMELDVIMDGNNSHGFYRYTRVWSKSENTWKIKVVHIGQLKN